MNAFKKALVSFSAIALITTQSYAALEVVSCSSDGEFTANSCNQCFRGGSVAVGQNKGLLTDVWENASDSGQVMFKEEQEMPQMISLGGATWQEIKASDSIDFWSYTESLEALYDSDNLGYLLGSGESVTWLESSLGSAYQLAANTAPAGQNIGLLAYDLAVHNLDDDGTLSFDADTHRECVLYTSETEGVVPTQEPEKLPETGAEHIILVLAALGLGLGFMKMRKRK